MRTTIALLTSLAVVATLSAQQTPPLQFKLVDVNQAVRKFQTTSMIRQPTSLVSPGKMDFSRVFPKISLAPFPPKQVKSQLPAAFKVPGTTSPVKNSFPFLKPQ